MFFGTYKDVDSSDLLNPLYWKPKKKVVIHVNFCSFFFARFLRHDPFEQSLRVIIKDPGDLQVDFLKLLGDKGRKDSPILCQVPIIPRSPVQVFTILLFKCILL